MNTVEHMLDVLSDKGILWMLKRSVVAEVDGISLVTFGPTTQFVPIITKALRLIREHDRRRFHRVQRHINWIFDHAHWGGAGWGSYFPRIKACRIDFEFLSELGDDVVNAACYAGLIVHEATHGLLAGRRFQGTDCNRERVERICYMEQNRCLLRLNGERPGLGDSLIVGYEPSMYSAAGKAEMVRRLIAEFRRSAAKEKPNPGAHT